MLIYDGGNDPLGIQSREVLQLFVVFTQASARSRLVELLLFQNVALLSIGETTPIAPVYGTAVQQSRQYQHLLARTRGLSTIKSETPCPVIQEVMSFFQWLHKTLNRP
jgi:hypothetical protein